MKGKKYSKIFFGPPIWEGFVKRFSLFMLCIFMVSTSVVANINGQNVKLDLDVHNKSLIEVIDLIKEKSGLSFVYSAYEAEKVNGISLNVKNESLEDVLKSILKGTTLTFSIEDDLIVLKRMANIMQNTDELKSYRIVGYVVDEKNHPLPGVTVRIKNTTAGTATDVNGYFGFTLPMERGSLIFTFIGFKQEEIEFKVPMDTIRLKMVEDMSEINEVVVRAYGTQNRREVISAISSVKADEMKELPTASILNMLQGRMAGVNIVHQSGAPGSASVVAIRGFNSLLVEGASDGQPLYVVDGVPIHSFVSPQTGVNTLADLDPATIESVEVLKDAAAASIYGSRASNGVILITTKQGVAGEARFAASGSYSLSKLIEYPLQTGGRLERWYNILYNRNMISTGHISGENVSYYPTSYEESYYYNAGTYDNFWKNGRKNNALTDRVLQDSLNPFHNNSTNWWKYAYQTGHVWNANISASGGSERVVYMMGAGIYSEKGIMINSNYKRVNLISNVSARPSNNVRFDIRLYGAYVDKSTNTNTGLSRGRFEGINISPQYMSTLLPNTPEIREKWLEKANNIYSRADDYRLMGNIYLELKIIDGLTFSVKGSADFSQGNKNEFRSSITNITRKENISSGSVIRNIGLLNEELLQYKKTIKHNHNIDLLLGFNTTKHQDFYIGGEGKGQPSDYIYYYNSGLNQSVINRGTEDNPQWETLMTYDSDFEEKTMVSYFGRVGYNYKQRYLAEMTIRRDGSSTFGEDHKWADFPSYAIGWAFSDEPFMQWSKGWLDWGKLRASYGTSGQIFTKAYLAHGLMMNGDGIFMGQTGMEPSTAVSPDLTWEKSKQYNIGADIDMLNYGISLRLDYYYKYTSSLIYEVRLPGNMLITSSRVENSMEVSNEGLELELKADILRKGELKWRTKFNISRNWNRLEKTYNGKDIGADKFNGLVIGRPINCLYVYDDDGYYESDDEVEKFFNYNKKYVYLDNVSAIYGSSGKVGTPRIKDLNGDGVIDEQDKSYAGSPYPLAHGGWVNELTWRNFDLNMLFNYTIKRSIINETAATINQTVKYVDLRKVQFWEKPGDNTRYPRLGSPVITMLRSNIEDVSSISLKQVTLGYNLPDEIAKKVGLRTVRAFATVENLFYLSNYSGENPEVVDIYSGIDGGRSFQLPRKWTLGLTINF